MFKCTIQYIIIKTIYIYFRETICPRFCKNTTSLFWKTCISSGELSLLKRRPHNPCTFKSAKFIVLSPKSYCTSETLSAAPMSTFVPDLEMLIWPWAVCLVWLFIVFIFSLCFDCWLELSNLFPHLTRPYYEIQFAQLCISLCVLW